MTCFGRRSETRVPSARVGPTSKRRVGPSIGKLVGRIGASMRSAQALFQNMAAASVIEHLFAGFDVWSAWRARACGLGTDVPLAARDGALCRPLQRLSGRPEPFLARFVDRFANTSVADTDLAWPLAHWRYS